MERLWMRDIEISGSVQWNDEKLTGAPAKPLRKR